MLLCVTCDDILNVGNAQQFSQQYWNLQKFDHSNNNTNKDVFLSLLTLFILSKDDYKIKFKKKLKISFNSLLIKTIENSG